MSNIVFTVIGGLMFLVSVGVIIITANMSDAGGPSDGSSWYADRVKYKKRRRTALFTLILIISVVLFGCNLRKTLNQSEAQQNTAQEGTDNADNNTDTNVTDNENPDGESQSPAEEATGGDNPEEAPEAEDASEDAGETEDRNTEEQIQADADTVRANVTKSVSASMQKFAELASSMAQDTAEKQTTEPQPESKTMTATAIRERVATESTLAWSNFAEAMGKVSVTNSIVKIDPDEIDRLFSKYYLDIPLHLDWEEANWLKERIAEAGRGHSDDMIGFPVYGGIESWLWYDQAIGCREVTAEDLKGVDLTDHEAVWKIVEPKMEAWKKEYYELSTEEQNSRVDELMLYAFNNMSSFSQMGAMTFSDMEWFYLSAKSILDDISYRYEVAYDIIEKDKKTEAVGRECFMEYPEDVEFFDPDRPWLNAVYTQDFHDNISGQISMLYMRFTAQETGKFTTDRHWCYPKTTTTALRQVAPASYTEKNGVFLRKLSEGKYGEDVEDLLANLDDGRLAIKVESRKTGTPRDTKPTEYNLDIDYVYADGSPTNIPHYHAVLKFGDAYRIVSPEIQGYTCDTPVVEGTMPARDIYYKVVYRKPSQTNKQDDTPSSGTPNDETPPDDDTPPTEEENPPDENKELPKEPVAEPSQNGDGENGGGNNTGNEDGTDKDQKETEDSYEDDWNQKQEEDSSKNDTANNNNQNNGDNNNGTTHEGNSNSSSNGGQSGTVTSTVTTDNGDGTSTTTEIKSDTNSERNEASEENFSGF